MLETVKRFFTVGGWKSLAGGALIAYAAYLGASTDCIDIECTRQAKELAEYGQALLGVGVAHKLQKLTAALSALLGPKNAGTGNGG
jgi:hypothetical protein